MAEVLGGFAALCPWRFWKGEGDEEGGGHSPPTRVGESAASSSPSPPTRVGELVVSSSTLPLAVSPSTLPLLLPLGVVFPISIGDGTLPLEEFPVNKEVSL